MGAAAEETAAIASQVVEAPSVIDDRTRLAESLPASPNSENATNPSVTVRGRANLYI